MDQIQTFNTIKNVFAALGAKTADNNYAVPLLNKSNASPQGFMDMASLASVLGGAKEINTNIDTILTAKLVWLDGLNDQRPYKGASGASGCLVKTIPCANNRILQISITLDPSGIVLCYRCISSVSMEWSSWYKFTGTILT